VAIEFLDLLLATGFFLELAAGLFITRTPLALLANRHP
jgi:hypothetical protein